jgi:DNA-binding MarR family transcriptional regulator
LTERTLSDSELVELMPVILRAFRTLTAEADKLLERHELGRAHFRALGAIALQPGATLGEVITTLGITLQAINRIMVHLQTRALIRGELDPDDRRRRRLFVTAEGQRIFDEVMAAQLAVLRHAIKACGTEGFDAYRAFLRAMADAPMG